jgi:hypothetical protein
MNNDETLDLSEIDPPIWRIMANDIVYGPYTLGQMRAFQTEGRVAMTSKVADGDGGAFMEAKDQPRLASLFRAVEQMPVSLEAAAEANYLIGILNEIGRFAELMPGTFVLSAAISIGELRKRLNSVSEMGDKLVVVNADNGRLAWLGLGPETDIHVRSVWKPKS